MNGSANIPDLSTELVFQTSRSSGPGGQNVNKVNTKVELRFDVPNSNLLTGEQKAVLLVKLASRMNSDGVIMLACQEERSQLKNKELVVARLYSLLWKALTPVKKRRATKPTRSSVERRLLAKKIKSERKSGRGKLDY